MNWLTGGTQGEAKRLITQLADFTKRGNAAMELIKLDEEAIPSLIDALQTQDMGLPAIYSVKSEFPVLGGEFDDGNFHYLQAGMIWSALSETPFSFMASIS